MSSIVAACLQSMFISRNALWMGRRLKLLESA